MIPVLTENSYISSTDFSVNYELIKKIGEGSFSNVWLCVNRNNGKELAAKILKKNFGKSVNATTLDDISEIRVARLVGKHPFLLMVEGVYHRQETGEIILFTELMKKSFYDLIKNGECPLLGNRMKSYTYQMLEGNHFFYHNHIDHLIFYKNVR